MIRISRVVRCFRGDLGTGKPSPYRPRFRPRRIVMPVDTTDLHNEKRTKNVLLDKHRAFQRIKKQGQRRGALSLASVPAERSVGDAFRHMLEVCEREQFVDSKAAYSLKAYDSAMDLVDQYDKLEKTINPAACSTMGSSVWPTKESDEALNASPMNALGLSTQRDVTAVPHKSHLNAKLSTSSYRGEERSMAIRKVDNVWAMLDRTPLNSPVHGALALRGKALVESCIAREVYRMYPRLRSRNLQLLLHESAGLLPCGRIAVRLGFAEFCGVSSEIGLWRELNVLTERFRIARRMASAHLQRIQSGVAQQRRWYWRGVLKSAAGRLRLFPVGRDDIQPRMEWIRSSLFAFIAFVELAERSGEPNMDVQALIIKLFCSQLGAHALRTRLLERMTSIAEARISLPKDGTASSGDMKEEGEGQEGENGQLLRLRQLQQDVRSELARITSLSADDLEVLNERVHPLNALADKRAEQFQSSGGAHATQSLQDDIFDDYRVTRHQAEAPPSIIHSIEPSNAFKEAQLILRYDPFVPASLRNAPIDVDQVVRRTVEVHETNPYATLSYGQQFRQTEYTVCRLIVGSRCLGEGKGETDMLAMNEAAMDMLLNYYLKPPPHRKPDPSATESGSALQSSPSHPSADAESQRGTTNDDDDDDRRRASTRTSTTEDVEMFF